MGRAVAELLSAVGASVVIGDIDLEACEATAITIKGADGRVAYAGVDVARKSDVDDLVGLAADTFGGLDIMCNIAGVPAPSCELTELGEDEYERVMGINVKGVLYGCQAAAPLLAESSNGTIINVASTAFDLPSGTTRGHGVYTISKFAVVAMTRVLAHELGAKGVRVNAIAPGVTMTNFVSRHFTDEQGSVDPQKRDDFIKRMSQVSPLGVVGFAEDQAWLVLYLASDAARFVTGQVIRANGGWSMA
jgi:3-oxoacyl-[acyl-carrier protein] reductase